MIRVELSLRLANSPGALAGVCRLLSDERINVQAMGLEAGGQLRLVVDNHIHAAAMAPALRLISDAGVNVEYAYGGGAEGSATATIVLGVEDAERASAAAGV
jgi:hypothetical protein